MDGISKQIVNVSVQMTASQLTQAVQLGVLKKALDVQAAGVVTLLGSATGSLPLATSGPLGTQVNELV